MSEKILDTEDRDDDAYVLDNRRVSDVLDAVERKDASRLIGLLDPMHPADIADLLEQIGGGARRSLLALWQGGMDGDVLSEIDEGIRDQVIDDLAPEVLAEAVRELETDDVVDIVEDLEQPQQQAVLGALEDSERAAVEQSLSYPEESAGRLMQREVVTGPAHWTVGQAIDFLRKNDDLPEQFYHLVLVDPKHRPVGYVTLGKLLSCNRSANLADITEDSFRTIPADQPEEDVAYAFNQYHLISAPVVNDDNRLVGIITIDDAMVVLDDEHEEDILRLAGVDGESSLSDSIMETTRRRFPWLFVNLLTAILASLVIAQFEDTIAQFVALAILMPIVASMGGNAGTQSLTVAVRAIATKDLTSSNVWRVIVREISVGLLNGLFFALIMGAVGAFWFDAPLIGVVLGIAMVVNLLIAGFAGVLVPVTLEKAGVDPALASGTFVTTVTDVIGFFAFLGLAGWILL